MEARAVAKYVKMSPLKVRRVAQMIRGQRVSEAQAMLKFTQTRAARVLEKVLNSAVANAENNLELDRDELVVARAYVDKGPSMKRMTPRARGRADILTKRSSHVTVIVADRGR